MTKNLYIALVISLAMIFVMACGTMTAASFAGTVPNNPALATQTPANGVYTATPHTETVTALIALNVRSSGSEDGEIVSYLSHGDTVTIQGECNRNGWVNIGIGWVNADYLSGYICEVRK